MVGAAKARVSSRPGKLMGCMAAMVCAITLQRISDASTNSDDASVTAGLGGPVEAAETSSDPALPTLPPGIAPVPIAVETIPATSTTTPPTTATTVPRTTTTRPPTTLPPSPPGSPKAYARGLLASYGWADSQFSCLDSLWTRESHWNPRAANPRSEAYGIPQANPGSKMASVGADWRTNYQTQIRWGFGYISERYGTPCGAWNHSEAVGWY
jgi:hypothetical protein